MNIKYSMSVPEKDEIIHQLKNHISREFDDVLAAYIFGSFIGKDQFSDIDIELLLKVKVSDVLEFELALEAQFEKIFIHPFDVRVLNENPNSFTQNVVWSR